MRQRKDFEVNYPRPKHFSRIRAMAGTIGRRGSFLLFLAMLDLVYGWSLIYVPDPRHGAELLFSPKIWAVGWLITGAVCLWQAFVKVDRLAFTMSVVLNLLWGITMFYSWYATDTNPYGWIGAVIFSAFAGVIAIVSYWPEPRRFTLKDL